MIRTSSPLPPANHSSERGRILAKVYSLLISLAEDAENHAALPEIISAEEVKIVEPNPLQACPINEEICVDIEPEFATPDPDQSSNSVPLKNNIPS